MTFLKVSKYAYFLQSISRDRVLAKQIKILQTVMHVPISELRSMGGLDRMLMELGLKLLISHFTSTPKLSTCFVSSLLRT